MLEEQDPNLIEVLLRFIYAKGESSDGYTDRWSDQLTMTPDINLAQLKQGKDIPALCIRLFRVGGFFLLDELQMKARQELKAQVDTALKSLDTKTVDADKTPEPITEILDALEEAYVDDSTVPIRKALLELVRLNKHKIFSFKDAFALLDKIPELAKDLVKIYLNTEDAVTASPRPDYYRLGLAVRAALKSTNEYYELGVWNLGESTRCHLYPVLNDRSTVFTAVNPVTEQETSSLKWIVPPADQVRTITSRWDSEIVRVDLRSPPDARIWLYIRFDDPRDAGVFARRYCEKSPMITSMSISLAASMSTAMQMRLERVTNRAS